MNRIVKFFHELRHPHCEHCREEREDSEYCDSCETYRIQLERVNYEKNELLSKLLELTNPTKEVIEQKPIPITPPRTLAWAAQRQKLEADDRRKAAELKKNAPRPDTEVKSTEELEKEIVGDDNAIRQSNA